MRICRAGCVVLMRVKENACGVWLETLIGKDCLEVLGVHGRIILK